MNAENIERPENFRTVRLTRWAVVCQAKGYPPGTESLVRGNCGAASHFDTKEAAETWLARTKTQLEEKLGMACLRVRAIDCYWHGESCSTLFSDDENASEE